MTRTTDDISQLVERFFDGETTLDEERRLYRFFASGDVPGELAAYTEMFRDLGAADEECGGDSVLENIVGERERRPLFARLDLRLSKARRIVACAAAAVLLAFGLFLVSDLRERDRLASLYGGSYMIVDGKRIDDLKRIRPQIEHALRVGEEMEKMTENAAAVRQAEQHVLDNIGDPAERERVRQLLNI